MTTKSKNLRTGRSIWEDRPAPAVPHGPLTRNLKTDVLVIGAGITGAMIADALTTEGLKVTIVDRRGSAKGSTTASTALVQYEIDTPLTKLARKIGKRDAERAWRRSLLAVDALAARFREINVSGTAQRNSLYLAGNLLGRDDLRREHDARRAAGIASRYLGRSELRGHIGIDRPAALLGFSNMVIDPRRITRAMLRECVKERGVKIFAPADIVDVDPGQRSVVAFTDDGHEISCRHLVFASGYELPDSLPKRGHKIVSTWVIATVPQRKNLWPGECTIWEASDPYLYLRTTADGRVICGGEDEDFSDEDKRDALMPRKAAVLRKKLKRLLPKLDTRVDFAWTGAFGQTSTGLPTIGEIPGMPNCFAALGYGGNGITYARIAADVISGTIAGRGDTDADLYDFPRPKS